MKEFRMVDLFAGAGGASTGGAQAGAKVLLAANHWRAAVDTHAENHPGTIHLCQDLQQANWAHVPAHDLLWASPACQGHSRASNRKHISHDAARATAWAIVSCAEFHRPRFVMVENVVEFARWELYKVWVQAMECLGYSLTVHQFNAADFGVPQSRVRLFILATLKGALTLENPGLPHKPCRPIIDWDQGFEGITRDRFCEATTQRIKDGRAEHGKRFWIPCYGGVKGGRSVDRPFGTLTTRAQLLIVNGRSARFPTIDECRRAMSFPDGYRLPTQRKLALHMLGNAVPPAVARHLIKQLKAA